MEIDQGDVPPHGHYQFFKTLRASSAVKQSAVLQLSADPDHGLDLALARENSIEIYHFDPNTRSHENSYEIPIFGEVAAMRVFRRRFADSDSIFVCSMARKFSVFSLDPQTNQIVATQHGWRIVFWKIISWQNVKNCIEFH